MLWEEPLMDRVGSGKCTSDNMTYVITEGKWFVNKNAQIFNDIPISYGIWGNSIAVISSTTIIIIIIKLHNSTFLYDILSCYICDQ